MRCWASFAVSVAVLIGQPYYVHASSPSAAQISAAEEPTGDSASRPARHSVGDKRVARRVNDEQASPKLTTVTPAAAAEDASSPTKTTRSLSDANTKRSVADAAVKRNVADATVKRNVADATVKRSVADAAVKRHVADAAVKRQVGDAEKAAAPQVAEKTPTSPQPTSISLAAPQPAALKPAAPPPAASQPVAAKPAAPTPAAPTPAAVAKQTPPKAPSVSRKLADEPVAKPTPIKAAEIVRTPTAPPTPRTFPEKARELAAPAPEAKPIGSGVAEVAAAPSVRRQFSAPASETIAVAAPFVAPAPAALVVASKPATPVASTPAPSAAVAPLPLAAAPAPASIPASRPRVVQTVADSAPIVESATRPSTPIRRSFSVQAASQPGPMPTPAVRSAVPQPEPDSESGIKSASDAPVAQAPQQHGKSPEPYVDGDYCLDCEDGECCDDCHYGVCDLHHDLKAMARIMHPHYPYEAQPWTYYYFRPYHYRHIEAQQQEAMAWGADPNQPYARKLFDKIYDDLEKQMAEKENAAEDGK